MKQNSKPEGDEHRYYVYCADDGNQDGLMFGYSLEQAKAIADNYAAECRRAGIAEPNVQVLEIGSGNYICSGR